jgi:ribosomal protein S18 acetylase RimI-like enzyme
MKKRIMNGRSHVSINYIGVLPAERRRHLGTSLLKHVLKRADEAQLPIFAEVWGQECLGWFQKFDFAVHAEKNYSDKSDAQVYYVVREPKTDPETPNMMSSTDAIAALHLEPPREDALLAIQQNAD